MAWSLVQHELTELLEAFVEAERLIEPAFTKLIRPYGFFPAPTPIIDQFRPNTSEWRIGWLLPLPDRCAPFEIVRCELSLDEWAPWREVAGWIRVDRYVGRGLTADEELWCSANHQVETPATAAAALRTVAKELVEQLGRVDLQPYLGPKPI